MLISGAIYFLPSIIGGIKVKLLFVNSKKISEINRMQRYF